MQISRGIWIQESLAWPLWKHADSRRWSNAGHQNSRCFPKLLAKFRRKRKSGSQTCHALSNVSWNRRNSEICRSHDDKWMVLQWKINLVFVSFTSELEKILWCSDKTCTLQSRKKPIQIRQARFYTLEKRNDLESRIVFWSIQHLHTICNTKIYHMFRILHFFKKKNASNNGDIWKFCSNKFRILTRLW